MTPTAWFLIGFGLMGGQQQYIGPLPQDRCEQAAVIAGIQCAQASAVQMCDKPNRPGVYMVCPQSKINVKLA